MKFCACAVIACATESVVALVIRIKKNALTKFSDLTEESLRPSGVNSHEGGFFACSLSLFLHPCH